MTPRPGRRRHDRAHFWAGLTCLLALWAEPGWIAAARSQQPAAMGQIEVSGSEFRVRLADGRTLAGEALVGTVLSLGPTEGGGATRVRIDSVERDPEDASGDIVLYGLSTQATPNGEWQPYCTPDP